MKLTKTVFASIAIATLIAPIAFAQTTTPTPTPAPAVTTTPAVSAAAERPKLRQPTMKLDGYTTVASDEISSEELTGADAYGADDTDIGKVDGLVLSADGKTVDHIVLDIGGFLGIGVHQVALTPSEVQIMRKGTDGDIRVYVDATKAELKAQPSYKK